MDNLTIEELLDSIVSDTFRFAPLADQETEPQAELPKMNREIVPTIIANELGSIPDTLSGVEDWLDSQPYTFQDDPNQNTTINVPHFSSTHSFDFGGSWKPNIEMVGRFPATTGQFVDPMLRQNTCVDPRYLDVSQPLGKQPLGQQPLGQLPSTAFQSMAHTNYGPQMKDQGPKRKHNSDGNSDDDMTITKRHRPTVPPFKSITEASHTPPRSETLGNVPRAHSRYHFKLTEGQYDILHIIIQAELSRAGILGTADFGFYLGPDDKDTLTLKVILAKVKQDYLFNIKDWVVPERLDFMLWYMALAVNAKARRPKEKEGSGDKRNGQQRSEEAKPEAERGVLRQTPEVLRQTPAKKGKLISDRRIKKGVKKVAK